MHIHRTLHRRAAPISSKPSALVERSVFPSGPPTTASPVSATYQNLHAVYGDYLDTAGTVTAQTNGPLPTAANILKRHDYDFLPIPNPQAFGTLFRSTIFDERNNYAQFCSHESQVGPYMTSSDISRRDSVAATTTSCYMHFDGISFTIPCHHETTTLYASTPSINPRGDPNTPPISLDIFAPESISTASPSANNLAPRRIHLPFEFFMDEGTHHCYKYPRSYHVAMGMLFLAFAIAFSCIVFLCGRCLLRRKARQIKAAREAAAADPERDYKYKQSTGRTKGGKYKEWKDEDVTVRKWHHRLK